MKTKVNLQKNVANPMIVAFCVIVALASCDTKDVVKDIAVADITLDETSLNLWVGEKTNLKATIEPANATNTTLKWSSQYENVAIVSNTGEVIAVAKGETTITVATVGDIKKATCTVLVTDEADLEYVNATVLGKGLDCGNHFVIQFDDSVTGLPFPSGYWNNVYYEYNLPEEYKIAGKRISLAFRAPKSDENLICTTMGPGYPLIFIVKVK